MASKDVETRTAHEGTVATPTPAQLFGAYMLERAQNPETSPAAEDIEAAQLARILSAETEDEIWNADLAGTIAFRDLVGTELEILGMNVFLSTNPDFETMLGVFCTFPCVALSVPEDVTRATQLQPGDEFIGSTGASAIIAKVRMFEARELLPQKALVRGISTSRGNTVLKLVKPPARATQGTTEK